MDHYPRAPIAHRLGKARVVTVGVCEHERFDVAQRVVQQREVAWKGLAEARKTGVDRSQLAAFFDQVPVDQ
jgi:hypothetical protein